MNHMDRDLYLALLKDNIDVLKGEDWLRDPRTPANNTVLHLACQHGSLKCVEEILRRADKSLLSHINSRGETALHLAARQGYYGAVKALISRAKSSDPELDNLETTSSTILQNLIRARNLEFETALHAAVRYNHKNVVELLVKEDPSYSYPLNKYDETPLYLAAVRLNLGVTKVILDNCESPTFGGPHGRTALHAALMTFHITAEKCSKLLLKKNKDLIKEADNDGWTAFHYLSHNNLHPMLEFLLSVDKSVAYLADKKYKRTPLHVAAYKGHHVMLKGILDHLPDAWESVDGNGQNILHIALKQEQESVIRYIFSKDNLAEDMKSSLLIQRDKEGNTPLHLIAKVGRYIPKLKNARDWNADWEAVNDTNFTPLEMLYQKHHGALIDKELVGVTLDRSQVISHLICWINGKCLGKDDQGESPKENITRYRQMANSHMIVTALITTVALTAGFAMPGGFDSNQGPDQGSPALLRKTAFKIFMVADTVTLVFSISSLFLYFLTSFKLETGVIYKLLISAIVLNVVSIAAMMLAFIAGTYAVLSDHSTFLAISVCIISSLFLLLVFYVCFIPLSRMLRRILRAVIYLLHLKFSFIPHPLPEPKELWNV